MKWIVSMVLLCNGILSAQNLNVQGTIRFTSTAPQEKIIASSKKLTGLIKPEEQSFAFIVDISSFNGFNSPLQKIHFNENYMESTKYPKSTFYGKIIENINWNEFTEANIRTKGYLEIHGIKKERIIQVRLIKKNEKIYFYSDFSVNLSDHKISIPRIVHQKLSEQIAVHVTGTIRVPKK